MNVDRNFKENNPSISVVILTYNEELHIERCIKSVLLFAREVFVIDSYSNDRTLEIATSLGAKVLQNPWVNYATQFNWGLDNAHISSTWVMRLDADEYVTDELQHEICNNLAALNNSISGIYVKRRVFFMGRWIKRGGYYPTWLLRFWRNGHGYLEQRWMDEHIKLTSGEVLYFHNDIIDDNLNNLSWWTAKHNSYATREAIDVLNIRYNFLNYDEIPARLMGSQEQRRRWLKLRYASLPLFVRPVIYFVFRYFLKLGFIDGKEGLIWHFLQGFWYRFLVDAKVFTIEKCVRKEGIKVQNAIKEIYGVDV